MNTPARPVLAITLGDVAGIGPEIVVKALARPEVQALCRPLIVGDEAIVRQHLRFWPGTTQPQVVRVAAPAEAAWREGELVVLQPGPELPPLQPGESRSLGDVKADVVR